MADDADRAQVAQDLHLRLALTAHRGAADRTPTRRDGNCIDCDEPIPTERLAALPNAERCIYCQERQELHAR